MNQLLSPTAIKDMMSSVLTRPKPAAPAAMSRREKLMLWASVIRSAPNGFVIFHNLEHYRPDELVKCGHALSAFHAALNAPALQEQGLNADMNYGDTKTVSATEAMRFFELKQSELHEFSCDCGGSISREDMARRIEGLAQRS